MKQQKGVLLVESMVSLAIFSIAVLGLSALQLTSSKNNLSALVKTEVAVSNSEIIDLMRANLGGVAAGQYNYALGSSKYGSPANQAQTDINTWIDSWILNLSGTSLQGVAPQGSIACGGGSGLDCAITLQWDDSRAADYDPENPSSSRTFTHVTDVNL